MASDPVVAQLKPDQVQEITTAFMEFDLNRNGYITAQEMKECLRRSNIQFQDAEVDRVISNMDSNRDGTVSYDEYMKFMARVYTGQFDQFQRGPPTPAGQNPPYNSNQTPFNTNQPPYNQGQPPYNTNQPPNNQNQPPYNTNQPPYNQSQPPYNQGQPPYNQGQPPYNSGQPPYNQGQPPYNQGQPPYNQGQPPYNQGQPPYNSNPSQP
jgi:hypothetical protein